MSYLYLLLLGPESPGVQPSDKGRRCRPVTDTGHIQSQSQPAAVVRVSPPRWDTKWRSSISPVVDHGSMSQEFSGPRMKTLMLPYDGSTPFARLSGPSS
jgi:hypothetical protein